MRRPSNILMILAVILALLFAFSCSKKEAAIEGYTGGETADKSLTEALPSVEAPAPSPPPTA